MASNELVVPSTPVHVVGIGLDGAAGLTAGAREIIDRATLLVGSARHLGYFPTHPARQLSLGDLSQAIVDIRYHLAHDSSPLIVILTSGDPLFFGLGRLLLTELPAEILTFHPHLSSIQLAFSRLKLPWQDVCAISAHGRSLDALTQALQQGAEKIAVLTDGTNTPTAIARLVQSLDLPVRYHVWVCENLGGPDECLTQIPLTAPIADASFAPLNVVVLQRMVIADTALDNRALPLLGIPDACFVSFRDRPGLMTKREVRVQILGELALQPAQVVWDIGAGTGSVSIELARLCPDSVVYAIEQTAIGVALIQQNCQRFQVQSVTAIHGAAPSALATLPSPDRIFIGGSGGQLASILDYCKTRLHENGRIVLALATVEHQAHVLNWLAQTAWHYRILQVQLARSLPVAHLTRLTPLNPVTLMILERRSPTHPA